MRYPGRILILGLILLGLITNHASAQTTTTTTTPPPSTPPATEPNRDEADTSYSNTTATTTEDGASIKVENAIPGEVINSPAVPAWVSQCDWDTMTTEEMGFWFVPDDTIEVRPGSTTPTSDQVWAVVYCGAGVDTEGAFPTGVSVAWPLDDDELPQVVIDWLIAYAYALVEVPVQVGWSAPYGDEDAPLITQLPTWLWVEPEVWSPRSATTPSVLGLRATVTVTPINVTFTGPDNETIDCGPNLGPPTTSTKPNKTNTPTAPSPTTTPPPSTTGNSPPPSPGPSPTPAHQPSAHPAPSPHSPSPTPAPSESPNSKPYSPPQHPPNTTTNQRQTFETGVNPTRPQSKSDTTST